MKNLLASLLAVLLVAAGVHAFAETPDVEKQIGRMNKRAMEDYDSLEFESARKTLIDAVAMLRANGIDDSPVAAKTYVNLGMVYIAGFKDRNRGIQQLVSALKIKPDFKLDPAMATPELEEAFTAAQKQVGTQRPIEKPPVEEKPDAHGPSGLQHTPVDESRPNAPIPVRAQLGEGTGATRLFLFFRGSGQEDFISVPMKQQGADWVGVIPAEVVGGHAIQYYLEARDARGRTVVNSGSAPNPYLVAISESAAPPVGVLEVDVEDPLAKERARKRRDEEERRKGNKLDRFFFFVMPGFGFGVQPAGNHTEVAYQWRPNNTYQPTQIDATGFAVAPFHLAVEIGGQINNAISLSVVGRFQFVTGANAETSNPPGMLSTAPTSKASGAIAAYARARYRFLSGKFHPYVHLLLGGGQIRQSVDLALAETNQHPLIDAYSAANFNPSSMTNVLQEVCPNHNNCTDTVALGYLLLGGGAGLWYDVVKHFAVIVDLNLIGAIGVGDSQSGFNVDVQVGVGAHF